MANLASVVERLRQERAQAEQQVRNLDKAIAVLSGITTGQRGRRGGRISAAGRRRIAAAQRARWAKARGASAPKPAAKARSKRRMSAAARNRIAAAQKARWAKWRAKNA